MTKKSLTEITVTKKPRDIKTEQWNLMPIGTTFIHDDGQVCIKITDEFFFDFEEKDTFSVVVNPSLIYDVHEDLIEFELVDISVTVKRK